MTCTDSSRREFVGNRPPMQPGLPVIAANIRENLRICGFRLQIETFR